MYDLDYVDENTIESAKKSFLRIYPEFRPIPMGVSQDRTMIIFRCDFPDGTFYFRVDDRTVSQSYNSLEDADRT